LWAVRLHPPRKWGEVNDEGALQYALPSWTEGGVCKRILSINRYGFYFSDEKLNCDPTRIRLREDTAPSGTAYYATITANCYPDGPVSAGKLRTFEFMRYKGHLDVTATTPHGRLMLTVLGGLAEFERELIKARTDEGRNALRQEGFVLVAS
jgi:hypothetical protein